MQHLLLWHTEVHSRLNQKSLPTISLLDPETLQQL